METQHSGSKGKALVYDAVYDTVKRIGDQEPVVFQRDGRIVIASERGFGIVDYALPVVFREKQFWETRRPEDKLKEPAEQYSRPVNLRVESPGWNATLVGDDPELRYFQPLVRHPEGEGECLEDMTALVRAYRQLPSDGNVRLLAHSSAYHSHKWGYGGDGIDVVPEIGRVMPMERFLELVVGAEEAIFANIDRQFTALKGMDQFDLPSNDSIYGNQYNSGRINMPDGFVLTPNAFVSFIRKGSSPNFSEPNNPSWGKRARLRSDYPVQFRRPDSYQENPFRGTVIINSHKIDARDAKSYGVEQRRVLEETARELEQIEAPIRAMEPLLARLNGDHNEAFAKRLEGMRRMREPRPQTA